MASPPKSSDSPPSSSPPPPSQGNSSPPPPSPSQDNSPPPPSQNDSSPPPPPDSQNSRSSPPPSSNDNSSPPPPPPSQNNGPPPPYSPPPPPPPPPPHTPPPPLSHHPPPRHSSPSHSSNSNSPSLSSSGLPQSTIIAIGAGVGGGLLFLVMLAIVVACCKKKKRRSQSMQMQYYTDPSHAGSNGNGYYPDGSQRGGDHIVKIPPPPGSWGAPPPQPPGPYSGSTMSSSYSGPYNAPLPPPHPTVALGFNKSTFSYDELAAATSGFSHANMLGQGGFGYVYKGVLPTGKEIAVKSLKSGSGQGEREFQAEVEIISRVHHRHLVSLVGYCIAGNQRLLIYEFVANDTLESHLHGKNRPPMEWGSRMRIALGSAKGLAYLHEDCHPKIIHRDIKASNILLDERFEAKVADFGLAKLSTDNHTHVSTRVMGTFGYLAPEYASSGKLTDKSDVFSFGIMLLELITGKRPVDPSDDDLEDCLVDWARPLLLQALEDGDDSRLIDPRLGNNYNPQEMSRMIGCAAASVRQSAKRRPKMSQIVRALEGDASLDDLSEGVLPGHSGMFGSSGSSDFDTHAEMRKIRNHALPIHESGSSEYGASGEYSHRHSTSSNDSREVGVNGRQKRII